MRDSVEKVDTKSCVLLRRQDFFEKVYKKSLVFLRGRDLVEKVYSKFPTEQDLREKIY